jgi:lipid-A-disaccharide synthase
MYQRAGIAATYVGHPLADAIPMEVPRAASRAALGLADEATVIALLPGSRRSEIRYILPSLLGAAALLTKQRPALKFVLPAMRGVRDLIDPLVAKFAGQIDLQVLDGRSHEALAACDLTLIASGTATLEAALFKRPMVITYNMHWLSWLRMKGMAYQPWVGLPNILARGFVVPELLQDSCTPEALAQAAEQWLDSPARCEGVRQRFTELHHLLRQDTARRATDAIAQILGR